jgi:hypothetical protein
MISMAKRYRLESTINFRVKLDSILSPLSMELRENPKQSVLNLEPTLLKGYSE